jgi:hypothetical protein
VRSGDAAFCSDIVSDVHACNVLYEDWTINQETCSDSSKNGLSGVVFNITVIIVVFYAILSIVAHVISPISTLV